MQRQTNSKQHRIIELGRSVGSALALVSTSLALGCSGMAEGERGDAALPPLEVGSLRSAIVSEQSQTEGGPRSVSSTRAEVVKSGAASVQELVALPVQRLSRGRLAPLHEAPDSDQPETAFPAPVQPALPGPETLTFAAPSPLPAASFRAAFDSGWIPPDTNGAVGPNHLVVAHNGLVAFQTRAGVTLMSTSLASFFSPVNTSGDVFDPLIRYDQMAGRWILLAVADRSSPQSAVLLAVSQTGDPTSSWNFFQIDADPADLGWADFPKLGFNRNWVVAQANLLGGNGDLVLACNKAALYAGTASCARFQDFELSFTNPAVVYDPALNTEYLGRVSNSFAGEMAIHTLTGPVGSETLTLNAFNVVLPRAWSTFAPTLNFAPQLGSDALIETDFFAALATLVVRNGSLWGTQTAYLPPEFPAARSSIFWWQANTSGGLEQFGAVDDPSGERFYAFPSLAVNQDEDVLIGYASFSDSQYASGSYSFRSGTDAPSTLRDEVILKAGEAPYNKDFGTGRNRWGDYTHTQVDPVDDVDLWTIQEFADLPENTWGTWWGRIEPPTPGDDGLRTTLNIDSDWGTGYCATLNVTNDTSETAVNFSVVLNMNGTSIYTSWNGNFSGSTGSVTVTPAFDWNRVLEPGETDSSIGFCANRAASGTNVAIVQTTTGTFTDGDAQLSTTLAVTNDWGAGYCATLSVSNASDQTVAGFTVSLNMNGTSIYTSWNGDFSGSTGIVVVTPLAYNRILSPGETDSSIGFCANRAAPGSNLALVVSTTAGD
jgi:hypothetical protein